MIDRRVARALQIAVLLCADAAVAAILILQVRGEDQAAFDLLAAGCVAGAVIAALALVAILARSRGLGGTALLLAWLRLAAVLVAVGVIAVRDGADAVIGPVETFAVAVAVIDGLAGLAAGHAANRWSSG